MESEMCYHLWVWIGGQFRSLSLYEIRYVRFYLLKEKTCFWYQDD